MTYFNKRFWVETIERAVKTAAQSIIVLVGGDALNAFDLDWQQMLGVGLGGAVVSVLTSVGSRRIGPDDGSPSLV